RLCHSHVINLVLSKNPFTESAKKKPLLLFFSLLLNDFELCQRTIKEKEGATKPEGIRSSHSISASTSRIQNAAIHKETGGKKKRKLLKANLEK
uniref:Uncharacterized protein n=1 Tax=Cucumis melo TaxID=3656 RepID=A0A9I9E840_CUCME